jgi:DNA-binding transcriptional LysR family regulator
MRVTLAQLETYHWIAQLGSFQDAAKQLNLSQPTVSLRIRDLERALGVRLFDRSERSVRLTHDGEALRDLADSVLRDVRQIYERVGAAELVQGVLRLGIPETFALVCLPELLRILESDHPALRLELDIGTSATLLKDLEERRIELAVVGNLRDDPRIRSVPLGQHEMVWAASPQFGLKQPIRPSDLRTLPIISNAYPAPQYQMIMEWFRSAGVAPLRLSTCTSVTVISSLVAAGIAISLLPLPIVRAQAEIGQLVVLASRPTPTPSFLHACHRAAEGSSNVNAVVRAIASAVVQVPFLQPI